MSTSAALLSLNHAKESIMHHHSRSVVLVRFVTADSDNSYYHIMNRHIHRYSYSIAPKIYFSDQF
jgi:hypothetical protein